MKTRATVALLICLLLAPAADSAQRRRRSSPKRATPAAPAVDPAVETARQAGAQRIAEQIKTLSHFLYLLGGVVKTVESVERAASEANAPPDAAAQTARNKAAVKQSIQNVRVGLEQLETEFSSKMPLRPYYGSVIGVSSYAATAGQQVDAGQLDEAGRSLLKALDKLTDALVVMRRTP
jgi:hypothetical protein